MSLATRLSLYSTLLLAVAIAGFALTMRYLTQQHLSAEINARLGAALDYLATAIDVDDHDVEWDPPDEGLSLDTRAGEAVKWVVLAGADRIVATSEAGWQEGAGLRSAPEQARPVDWRGWRIASRRFVPLSPAGTRFKRDHHPELRVVVAASLASMDAALQSLTMNLLLVSGPAWVLAALSSWGVCRWGLAPLRRMAEESAKVTASTLSFRLPDPGTRDELGNLTVAFNAVLDRLEEAFEQQRRFTAEASHQLRTPLTGLLGQVEVARRKERSAEDYQRVLDTVHQEAERLRQIVEALLFLARSERDVLPLKAERINLGPWLADHLRHWSNHPRFAEICTSALPLGSLVIQTHPLLLGQILDVLLENALKYSDPGTSVVVRVSTEGNEVHLSVEDHGWGIPPGDLPRLFEPFFRSDAVRRAGRSGLGLGLAVAGKMARVLGGQMCVQSIPHQGTRFTIRLPRSLPE